MQKMIDKFLKSKVRIAMLTVALLLCSTLAIGARAWFTAPIETLTVTVNAEGFTPPEVTRSAGSFNLSVINQSGAQALTLRLTRDNGELVQEISVTQGAQQAVAEVTLTAGGYTLTEANHPAWLFHISAQ